MFMADLKHRRAAANAQTCLKDIRQKAM